MPVGEIVGEVLGGVLRVVGQLFGEIVGEFLIRGVGYAICRRISPSVDPEGLTVALVGLLFWIALLALGFAVYSHLTEWLAVDRCLDAGGTYDYATSNCVRG